MILVAEYVSPGHPDRLCDAIVNNIVNYVVSKDKDALCGLECAVHTNKVFVDGRIAAGKNRRVINEDKIKGIVRQVYKDAHYGDRYTANGTSHDRCWHPYPEELEIILDVCIERLSDDERELRQYSDDQNIVNGYALNSPSSDYFPVEHYAAIKIGEALSKESHYHGPDFKVLVQIDKENGSLSWHRLTISAQHHRDEYYKQFFGYIKSCIDSILDRLFSGTPWDSLSKIDNSCFYLNGAGDFVQGGPEGDNGLSGKKLCVDFYGPSVPIGGGAIYGKDPHKIDVCGALRARELAVKLVKEHGFHSVFTTLAWSPGEKAPYIIEAYEIDEFGTKFKVDDSMLPARDFFSIECINNDLNLADRKITSIRDIK